MPIIPAQQYVKRKTNGPWPVPSASMPTCFSPAISYSDMEHRDLKGRGTKPLFASYGR